MKPAPSYLQTFLQSDQLILADLFTFTLLDGTILLYTNATEDIVVPQPGGQPITWIANDVLITGARLSCKIGVSVDEQTLKLAYRPTSMVGGQTFAAALWQGLFDGAFVERDRVGLTAFGQPPVGNGENGADGRVTLFYGRVSTIDQAGRVSASIKVKSLLSLLTLDMPHNLWQPGCLHTLYDAGCTLIKSAHAAQGIVGAGATDAVIPWSASTAAIYGQGTIRFQSGVNIDVARTVKSSSATGLVLSRPLAAAPAAGDSFVVYQGCDKTLATCTGRFANQAHFRGFPYVPPPEVGY